MKHIRDAELPKYSSPGLSSLVYSSHPICRCKTEICLLKNLRAVSVHKSVMTIIVKAINGQGICINSNNIDSHTSLHQSSVK